MNIGNRHLLHADGVEQLEKARTLTVQMVLAPQYCQSTPGQLMATCLINLLCRQVELVSSIHISTVAIPTEVVLPFEAKSRELGSTLVELASWAVGDAVNVSIGEIADPDVLIVVGRGEITRFNGAGAPTLIGHGCGWIAWVGNDIQTASTFGDLANSNPVGPFFAASMLAGEVFKIARGTTRGRALPDHGCSLWSGKTGALETLEDGPPIDGIALPPFHLVGAGAVGQSLAYVIGSAGIAAAINAVDDDSHDGTNLNRCFLAGIADVASDDVEGAGKVHALQRFSRLCSLEVAPVKCSVADYLRQPPQHSVAALRQEVSDHKFGLVVSCVDKNVSRHDIQGMWPTVVMGASTLNLTARCNEYDLEKGTPCLACHNPPEREGEKIRQLESRFRAMTVEDRRAFLTEQGVDPEAIERYLTSPSCGAVGETALRRLALRGTPMFSAGFVSLAAGVMLGVQLIKRFGFGLAQPAGETMLAFNFLNGEMLAGAVSVDGRCSKHCSSKRPERVSSAAR